MKKRLLTVMGIFLAAVLVRIIYTIASPGVFSTADSYGYYNLGGPMVAHPSLKTIVTPYRTPLYPIFMNSVMYAAGKGGVPYLSSGFLYGEQLIAAIQMLVGAIAFTIFFLEVRHLLTKKTAVAFGIFMLLDVFVIGWERTLFTEGLAVSLLLLMTAILIRIAENPKYHLFIVYFLFSVIGFLLRPAFMFLPLTTLPVIAWFYRRNRFVLALSLTSLFVYMTVPFAYAQINRIQTGYTGIQYVGEIDLLGRILESKVSVESAAKFPFYYPAVRDYETKHGIPQPFYFLERYDPEAYVKSARFIELQGFNRTVVFHQLLPFLSDSLRNIPVVLSEICEFTLIPKENPGIIPQIVRFLQWTYGKIQYLTLMVPVVWIVTAVGFFVKPTKSRLVRMILGTVATGQILLTALVVYRDIGGQYGRATSVIRTDMFLYLLLVGKDVWRRIIGSRGEKPQHS